VKISVVIPAHNAAAFLPRCLGSVFAQTLKPEEVVLVDDGSTDNTAALARELGAKVISQPSEGPAGARNTAIRNASSDWIALLDADDRWHPEKLERQAASIDPGTVLVYTGVRIFNDSGVLDAHPAVDAVATRKMLRYRNPITASSVLVKREALVRDGGFRKDVRGCEDWDMWMRAQELGEFVAVREPLTDYYIYPMSLSANPEQMLQAYSRIIDSTLLVGLKGLNRKMWKQRIDAVQLSSAGLIARENRLTSELRYMLRSLAAWPSPFWEPKRFALTAVTVRNKMRRNRGTI
jgi:glycosyltransferase involved in cell wall biosynthesis